MMQFGYILFCRSKKTCITLLSASFAECTMFFKLCAAVTGITNSDFEADEINLEKITKNE